MAENVDINELVLTTIAELETQYNSSDLDPTFWVLLNQADSSGKIALGDLLDYIKASPNLTGTPTCPTANVGTDTDQIASTRYVQAALSNAGLASAESDKFGTVKTDVTDPNPIVYVKATLDNLLSQKAPQSGVNANSNSISSILAELHRPRIGQTLELISKPTLNNHVYIDEYGYNWLLLSGQTLGNSTSGSTNANDDFFPIFEFLWENLGYSDWDILESDGSPSVAGANALEDWNNSKRLQLIDIRGRSPINTGLGVGLTDRNVETYGEEDHLQTEDEIAIHNHDASASSHEHNHTGSTNNNNVSHAHSGATGWRSHAHSHSGNVSGGVLPPPPVQQNVNEYNTRSPATGFVAFTWGTYASTRSVTTGAESADHYHAFSTGTQNANHLHAFSTTTDSHTHTVTVDDTGLSDPFNVIHPVYGSTKLVFTGHRS